VFLPETGPITDETIPGVPAVEELDAAEIERLARILDAVNGFVRDLPVSDRARRDTQEAANLDGWPDRIVEGAIMLAARLWRRKDTPGGVVPMSDGGVAYIRRSDPDASMLLELGEHGKPAAG
jgi:hypothetical protein